MNFGKTIVVAAAVLSIFVSCVKSGALTGGTTSGSGSSSFGNSINGSLSGGLSGIANATINLMIAGRQTPLGSANTASDGSYTIVFTNPGGTSLLYLIANGGSNNSNNQFLAIVGTTASFQPTQRVNELTTAAAELVAMNFGILTDSNGSITLAAPVNATGVTNAAAQYVNLIASGSLNSSNSNLTSGTSTGLNAMANLFAACVESPSKCASVFNAAMTGTGSAARSLLEAGYNALNNTATASNLYTIAFPLGGSTGFTLTSASPPGGFSFNNPLAAAINIFSNTNNGGPVTIAFDASGNVWVTTVGNGNHLFQTSPLGAPLASGPGGGFSVGLAIDATGNLWSTSHTSNNTTKSTSSGVLIGNFTVGSFPFAVAIDSGGSVWTANDHSANVTKLNGSGTVLGTFSAGSNPYNLAIDGAGNVWVTNSGGSSVTELNNSGTTLGTFTVGSSPTAIGIDPSGNVWVGNSGNNNVTKLNSLGTSLGTFSVGSTPESIAVDAAGNVWVTNNGSNTITELSPTGIATATYTVDSASSGTKGIGVDSSGNVWSTNFNSGNLTKINAVTTGPQFFPYSGPIFPGGNT